MAEGGIIPESGTAVDKGQEIGFDIRDKTIPLPDLEIKFPFSEELIEGHNYQSRFMQLHNPSLFSEEVQANAEYLKGVKEEKAKEVADELERLGHKTNLLVRGLGRFYDESSPPIQGVMNFFEVQDINKDKDKIADALYYVVESRLTSNAQAKDGSLPGDSQALLKKPVAVMVADQSKSIRIGDPLHFDWEIKPEAVIAIFPFYIKDPLVGDTGK